LALAAGTGQEARADEPPDPSPQAVRPLVLDPSAAAAEASHSALPSSAFLAGAASPVQPSERWYGYQIMASDLTSVGLAVFGSQVDVAGVGLLAEPSIIHAVNGRLDLAIGSPLLRAGLPALGALVGASAQSCSNADQDSWCGMDGALVGAGIGFLAAIILDWSLAWQTVDATTTDYGAAETRGRPSRISLTAAGVTPSPSGASVVIGGRF